MREVRIVASDPIYEEVNHLSFLISAYTNPILFPFDPELQIPEAERLATLETLKNRMEELFS